MTRFLLSALICAAAWAMPSRAIAADATRLVWFEDARHSPALGDETARAVAAYVRHKVLALQTSPPLMPRQVRDDFYPRVVFVSVSDGVRRARVVAGSARGVLKAADNALLQLKLKEGEKFEPRWVKVDVVDTIFAQEHVDFSQPLEYERSLFGLAFGRETGVALLAEELIGADAVDERQFLLPDQMLTYLRERQPEIPYVAKLDKLDDVSLFRFTTHGYFSDAKEIVPLYRGHRLWKRITRADLLESGRAAAQYLTRGTHSHGEFDYLYLPHEDRVPEDYNWVRHYGTIVGMLDAYEVLKDDDLLAAAKRALDDAERATGYWTQNGKRVACVIIENRVELGGNALAALALARYTAVSGDKSRVEQMRLFAESIVQAQRGDGSFIHYQRFPGGKIYPNECEYFPGESMLGLGHVYKVDPDPRWLDTSEAAAKHLILVRDKDVTASKLPHDHWLLYALEPLHAARPKGMYLEHELKIAEAIVRAQNRSPRYTDWLGSYYTPPNSTPTACRTEGLNAAYRMARDAGRRDTATRILETLVLNAAFQLQCQYRPETAMYFKDPQRCMGGMKESLTGASVRIDFVQHHMMGVLGLYRIMEQEKIDALAVPGPEKRATYDLLEPREKAVILGE